MSDAYDFQTAMNYTAFLNNEEATLSFGAKCTQLFTAPNVIYLIGDLGAGKTTFVRGFLQALGYQGKVKSPTYAVVESYTLPEKNIHHFDLYRFHSAEEWEDAGLDELITENSICFIEWPMQAESYVPEADWLVQLQHQEHGRLITINAMGNKQQDLAAWQK